MTAAHLLIWTLMATAFAVLFFIAGMESMGERRAQDRARRGEALARHMHDQLAKRLATYDPHRPVRDRRERAASRTSDRRPELWGDW